MTNNHPRTAYSLFCIGLIIVSLGVFISCKSKRGETKLKKEEIVHDTKTLNSYISENIAGVLRVASEKKGVVYDSLRIRMYGVMEAVYSRNDYQPLWSDSGKWKPYLQPLLYYLDSSAIYDGLFAEDYKVSYIHQLADELRTDSVKQHDAVVWTKADILLTNAFLQSLADVKQGRIIPDSVRGWSDTSKYSFYKYRLDSFFNGVSIDTLFSHVQPKLPRYSALRAALRNFTDSMDTFRYTYVNYPYTGKADSLKFYRSLQKRLAEQKYITLTDSLPDSAAFAGAIRKFQKHEQQFVDGKISAFNIRMLNLTDREKLLRIAITLDRYKQLPDTLPSKYIWVNLPGYYLNVIDSDTLAFTSKIVCGKPQTPTPLLQSAISDIVIYPTWTVPESIIKKEMLPALKRNAGYLKRKGLGLYNYKDEEIDPFTVNWSKYKNAIPYKIRQGSGEDNALGVIKFNFANPFAVYLHDTNQRYLFQNKMRALSHGCVRVKEWQQLAFYVIRNDSASLKTGDTLRYNTDSVMAWIGRQERHRIPVKFPIPLFIRYFCCEAENGKIRFYDDMYGEDKLLREKYFRGR